MRMNQQFGISFIISQLSSFSFPFIPIIQDHEFFGARKLTKDELSVCLIWLYILSIFTNDKSKSRDENIFSNSASEKV